MADIESEIEFRAARAMAYASFDVQQPPVMYNMRAGPPDGFAAEQLIYRRIVPAFPFGCRYKVVAPVPLVDGDAAVEEFVALAATGAYQPAGLTLADSALMAIVVDKDSYIVLHLDDSFPDWSFTHAFEAVTLSTLGGPPPPGESDLYGDLKYVRPDGTISETAVPGCRLVFFKARFQEGTEEAPHIQKFNMGVDAGVPPITYWVDPDVRHPGGTGQ